jgi:2-phosphosulfolactate phosphatase
MAAAPRVEFVSLENCASACGLVVAVDVCRAFTTAAYAFSAGASRILLVSTVEEALVLRGQMPGALVMGEVNGLPVEGFDLWNSPAQFHALDLRGKTLIQRTSAGTQGITRSARADALFAASFAVASATVRAIQRRAPELVTFVLTGLRKDREMHGLEDIACAEYMAALLRGETANVKDYLAWAENIVEERLETGSEEIRQKFQQDVALCALPDRFDFAMPVRRDAPLLIMEPDYAG